MHLSNLHHLLTSNRSNPRVTEREYIGRLIDCAHRSSDNPDGKPRSKEYYHKAMRNIYSTAEDRAPIPVVLVRALLYQRDERFDDLANYFATTLSDCYAVVRKIIETDDLRITNGYSLEPNSTFLSLVEHASNDYIGLNPYQKKRVLSAYIAEYYYHVLLWSLLLFALPDFEILQNSISQKFPTDALFNENILNAYRYESSDFNRISIGQQMLTANGYRIDKIGRSIIVTPTDNPNIFYRLPSQLVAETDHIKAVQVLNDYLMFLTDQAVLIYKRSDEKIYRSFRLPREKQAFSDARFLAFDFLSVDDSDDKKGILIVVTQYYYLEIMMDKIGWETSELSKKSGKTDDLILHELNLFIDDEIIFDGLSLKNRNAEYAALSGNEIHLHSVKLDDSSEQATSEIIAYLPDWFSISEIEKILVSPDHLFTLLIQSDNRAVLFDTRNPRQFSELCPSATLDVDNSYDQYHKRLDKKHIISSGFSEDSRYLAFTTQETLEDKETCVVTEVLDLQTESRQIFKENNNSQYRFIGFYHDQILCQWCEEKKGMTGKWKSMSELFR